jgi:hypothetical protein
VPRQIRAVSHATKHDGRLNNSVVRSRKWKRPNALKHGVHAQALIIPGEDRHEFEQLYDELIDEWKPSGPTQRDAVLDLADSKWRKRRLTKYVQMRKDTFYPDHPAFNEVRGLYIFLHYLHLEPENVLRGGRDMSASR